MAEVRRVVDSRAADVPADGVPLARPELDLGPRERVGHLRDTRVYEPQI